MVRPIDQIETLESRILQQAVSLAVLFYLLLIALLFWLWPRVGQNPAAEKPSSFLEAEIMVHPQTQLREALPSRQKTAELAISKNPHLGRQKQVINPEQQNETAAEPPLPPTHGPLVTFAPTPRLPDYLKNENLNTSILIEFHISANGQSTPYLLSTSGNEELDALALKTARAWIFRPATKDGQAFDSKVRLRINFEVK